MKKMMSAYLSLLCMGLVGPAYLPADTLKHESPQVLSNAIEKLHGQTININLHDSNLQKLADVISETFGIRFIAADMITKPDGKPLAPGLSEHKVSFTTNAPLTAKQALNLFKTFLEMAGFSMVGTYDPSIFRIMPVVESN